MDYSVRHRTTYRYLQDVAQSWHVAHLLLRQTPTQQVQESRVSLTPQASSRTVRSDWFGNACEWFFFDQVHNLLEVVAESRVRVDPAPERPAGESLAWEAVRRLLEEAAEPQARDAVQYMFDSPLTAFSADIAAYALESFTPGRPLLEAAIALMHRIHDEFRYDTTVTDATTPVDKVYAIRAGVCQDLAHAGIAAMRSIGLPARYVSGYLMTRPPPGKPRMVGADASHAWFSVFAPPFGWVDLDPTNAVIVGEGHVTAAWGRDYGDVAPVTGIILGGHDHVVDVGVDVIPVDDAAV
jgi:transglutaminase-like putative cysteine protease